MLVIWYFTKVSYKYTFRNVFHNLDLIKKLDYDLQIKVVFELKIIESFMDSLKITNTIYTTHFV